MLTSRLWSPQTSQLTVLALLAGALATASGGAAQELQDLKKPATPLVLQSQGSFTVGGDIVFSDALGTGGSGHIAVNQMYAVQGAAVEPGAGGDGSWRRPQRQVLRDDA
jgi:hypothetical protein